MAKIKVETADASAQGTPYSQPWVTDRAWITGVSGVLALVFVAYFYSSNDVFEQGFSLFGNVLFSGRNEAMFYALCFTAVVMIGVEIIRLWRFDPANFIKIDPLWKSNKTLSFFLAGLKNYLFLLLLFWCCIQLYHSLQEYGFRVNNAYYKPWFFVLDKLWMLFLVAGLPYVLVTRALKHNTQIDKKDLGVFTEKLVSYLIAKIPLFVHLKPEFTSNDRKAALGLLVKFFFAPVMTVFFYDQFGHLENNIGHFQYIVSQGSQYPSDKLGGDLKNLLSSLIFSIDVGLAWVGYVVSSRWVDNQTVSAEPTLLGWTVCLISYPPFRVIGGWFLTGPGEGLIYQLPSDFFVGLFSSMMLLSYFVYMLPTIWFGVRFSNLTHRGIIRTGPFAVVRHPAYAAKNFGWWCIGFPVAIYFGVTNSVYQGVLFTLGLMFTTFIYYIRAITEEKHLSADPDYVEYMKHVKYRFFPKLI